MGIFDHITINLPAFPHAGLAFQAYLDIADSYGDFYETSPNGYLYRLTDHACMSRNPKYALAAPMLIDDYTDDALEIYGGDMGKYAYLLTFTNGLLTGWRVNEYA